MKILVTGASGFVGRRTLAPLYALGFEVHAVSRKPFDSGPAKRHKADLLDPSAVITLLGKIAPTHVLHLAWYAEHGKFWDSPRNEDWATATALLARAAVDHGARHFIGVGSCAEYDWSDGGVPARRETDALAPESAYGRAKVQASREAERIVNGAGARFAWARLFHLFGADEPEAKFVRGAAMSLAAGEAPAVRSPQAVRDYMAVEDAGAALALLAARRTSGPVNIASGDGRRLGDIAALLADALGGAYTADGEGEPAKPPVMKADVGKLRFDVGFAPAESLTARLQAMAWSCWPLAQTFNA